MSPGRGRGSPTGGAIAGSAWQSWLLRDPKVAQRPGPPLRVGPVAGTTPGWTCGSHEPPRDSRSPWQLTQKESLDSHRPGAGARCPWGRYGVCPGGRPTNQ